MSETATSADYVREVIRDVARFANDYGRAVAHEADLHARKGVMKSEAVCRLIGTENAETQKPHSASSAEKIVESDEAYAAFLGECRASIVHRIAREADYECARLHARLEIALVATAPRD